MPTVVRGFCFFRQFLIVKGLSSGFLHFILYATMPAIPSPQLLTSLSILWYSTEAEPICISSS